MVRTIEVVVKISERCNINCTYCYMFNQDNEEYAGRPAYMQQQTVTALARFLSSAARTHHTEAIHIIFHGGEPMMMKPSRFDAVCCELIETLSPLVHLRFSMQTNAMLVDDRWLYVLVKHDVGVGVSIDGPQRYHDAERLGHNGDGTYERVVAGLRRLQAASACDVLKPVGAIAVIRPLFSGEVVFDHLVDDLGLRSLNFLLPIDTHDTFASRPTAGFGDYLIGVYRAWAKRSDKSLRVRFIDEALGLLTGGAEAIHHARSIADSFALFVVGSNGDLEPDDALKPLASPECRRPNITTHTLAEFVATPEMRVASAAILSLPEGCADCCWQNSCRGSGGRLVNRYSEATGFNNPSFLCESLKRLYSNVAASLAAGGFPREKMLEAMQVPPHAVMSNLTTHIPFGKTASQAPRVPIHIARA